MRIFVDTLVKCFAKALKSENQRYAFIKNIYRDF